MNDEPESQEAAACGWRHVGEGKILRKSWYEVQLINVDYFILQKF